MACSNRPVLGLGSAWGRVGLRRGPGEDIYLADWSSAGRATCGASAPPTTTHTGIPQAPRDQVTNGQTFLQNSCLCRKKPWGGVVRSCIWPGSPPNPAERLERHTLFGIGPQVLGDPPLRHKDTCVGQPSAPATQAHMGLGNGPGASDVQAEAKDKTPQRMSCPTKAGTMAHLWSSGKAQSD